MYFRLQSNITLKIVDNKIFHSYYFIDNKNHIREISINKNCIKGSKIISKRLNRGRMKNAKNYYIKNINEHNMYIITKNPVDNLDEKHCILNVETKSCCIQDFPQNINSIILKADSKQLIFFDIANGIIYWDQKWNAKTKINILYGEMLKVLYINNILIILHSNYKMVMYNCMDKNNIKHAVMNTVNNLKIKDIIRVPFCKWYVLAVGIKNKHILYNIQTKKPKSITIKIKGINNDIESVLMNKYNVHFTTKYINHYINIRIPTVIVQLINKYIISEFILHIFQNKPVNGVTNLNQTTLQTHSVTLFNN